LNLENSLQDIQQNNMIKLGNLNLQKRTCLRNDGYQGDLDNSIQLYVVVNRKCNAQCEFCTFRGDVEEVDIHKFKDTLEKIYKYYNISTLHLTGGEPTLDINKVEQICNTAKTVDKCIKTSVNTNGIHLNELDNIKNLNNVALSRHGITDDENYEIFKTNSVANTEQIKAFTKSKLHLSCNLIQGHVDSEEKIYQYLEMCSTLGVFDVGFVGLMNVNEYCKTRYIEFPNLSKCTFTKGYKNIETGECTCECRNWLYRAENQHLISIYHRHAVKSTNITSYLVYENNRLRAGFNGEQVEV